MSGVPHFKFLIFLIIHAKYSVVYLKFKMLFQLNLFRILRLSYFLVRFNFDLNQFYFVQERLTISLNSLTNIARYFIFAKKTAFYLRTRY